MTSSRNPSVSLFFPAGDFAEAWRRHDRGEQQNYATHDEVVNLLKGLNKDGITVNVYSYVTPHRKTERVNDYTRIISLGANRWDQTGLLLDTLESDDSSAIIPHFPNIQFIKACTLTGRNLMVAMASSYNRTGLRARWERRRIAQVLNDPKVTLVTNHCLPSTQKLADYGVSELKLVPWDIPHAVSPSAYHPKSFPERRKLSIAYAGSMSLSKGVGDLIAAISLLNANGVDIQAKCAGAGALEELKSIAVDLGVDSRVEFLGMIGNADVVELFHSSDLVCVPSRHDFPEGFPLTMFEAIASRTPVVCSDHPMFVPIMSIGARAEMFCAGDPRSLATAIQRALDNKQHYEQLSRNADQSWSALQGTADWRTLIATWVRYGENDPWIKKHTLKALRERK